MARSRVAECLTGGQGVAVSIFTGGTALCLVLVQPKKICPDMTENCRLAGT